MAAWVRNCIMLVVLGVWALYMVVQLARGEEINLAVLGIVGAVYALLNPKFTKSNDPQGSKKEGDPRE